MTESFLHGIRIQEIDKGPRPIESVKSNIIAICGTAPDAQAAVAAALSVGVVASNNALTFTAVTAGVSGNDITVRLADPKAASAALGVVVSGANITVNLATDGSKVITSLASEVITALTNSAPAAALITAANTSTSDGTGVVAAMTKQTSLTGGEDDAFPLNTPVLVAGSRKHAQKLDTTGERKGTLIDAMDQIFDQIGAQVVVVRVAEGVDTAATTTNVIGGTDVSGNFTGVHAFKGAPAAVHVKPKILIAPGFTSTQAVVSELVGIAENLGAVIVADGPNTTDEAAISYRENFGSPRVYVVDPGVKYWDLSTNAEAERPASACVAGVIAKTDEEKGYWWSPSNKEINGILGTSRQIEFSINDSNCRANYLNENEVATIVREKGYRLWGNRTCSADQRWAFLSVRRIADMMNEALLENHLWAVDRNISKSYFDEVTEGVNAFLRHLVAVGAILGGRCYADPDLNTPDQLAQGKVYFNVDFTPTYPAEQVTFRSALINDYLTEVLAA